MSAAISWGTNVAPPHGDCDCPECEEARSKVREARANVRAAVEPIPPRVFELLHLEAGIPEPADPWIRNMKRAALLDRWLELAGEKMRRAHRELDAALARAVEAREELVEKCEIAEVTLEQIARCVDEARKRSPWADVPSESDRLEEDGDG